MDKKAIQQAEKALTALSTSLQSEYYDSVWRSISNAINTRDAGAITSLSSNQIFVTAWKRIVGRGISKFFADYLNDFQEKATAKYSKFETPILSFSQVKKNVSANMKRNLEAFAKSYSASLEVANKIRNFAISQAVSGLSSAEVRTNIETMALGTDSALGVVDNFNLVKLRVQDTLAEYDRRLQNEYGTQLQLNYAVYQGGEIKTTREFCDERNGKVFTRETVASWNALEWEGKSGDVFTNCGGYNCRHFLDWISYELAVQLDPNIERSVYDTKL